MDAFLADKFNLSVEDVKKAIDEYNSSIKEPVFTNKNIKAQWEAMGKPHVVPTGKDGKITADDLRVSKGEAPKNVGLHGDF